MDTYFPWVAVVDDDEAVRRALLRLLRSAGVAAQAFASGAEFLDSLKIKQPYCVVLDLHMPGMSGFEVQSRLAEEAADIGVIVVTGHHSAAVYARAMQGKPIAYFLKPMNDQSLFDAIDYARTIGTHPGNPTHGAAADMSDSCAIYQQEES